MKTLNKQEAIKIYKDLSEKVKTKAGNHPPPMTLLGMMGVKDEHSIMAWLIDYFTITKKDLEVKK